MALSKISTLINVDFYWVKAIFKGIGSVYGKVLGALSQDLV